MNNKDQIKSILKRFSGQSNILTIPREYIRLCGNDHLAALLLSQIVYWSDRSSDPDGWIAKSYDEWQEELCMSQFQISRAIKKLKELGVSTKRQRSKYHKGGSTLHYRIDMDIFTNQIINKLDYQETPQCDNQETSQSHHQETSRTYTETTAKTTTENRRTLLLSAGVDTKETLDAARQESSLPSPQEAADAIYSPTAPTPPVPPPPPPPAAGQSEGPSVPSMIKAWLDALPAQPIEKVPAYQNKHYRRIAQGLIDAGYTPEQITAYVKTQLAETWREVKYVKFVEVGEKLPFWKPQKQAPQFAHPSHKPFDYEAAENSADGPIHPDIERELEAHLERMRKSA